MGYILRAPQDEPDPRATGTVFRVQCQIDECRDLEDSVVYAPIQEQTVKRPDHTILVIQYQQHAR
jgi:hypothetical protein